MARLDGILDELAARWAEVPPAARSEAEQALTHATVLIVSGARQLGPDAIARLQPVLIKAAIQVAQEVLLWGRPFDWAIDKVEARFPTAARFVKDLTGGG